MRHGTGAHLTLLDLLLEVIHGDIHPEVAVKVDDNRVDAAHGIKDGAQPVVVRYLCRVLLALQPQLLADKLIAEFLPVVLGIGHMMGIVVTRGTAELSGDRCLFQRAQLLLQTIDIDHDLLTQSRRRCRLTMSLGKHRNVLPLLSIIMKLLDELFHERIVHLFQCLLDTQGHAGIIDILRSKTEMDELLGLNGEAIQRINAFLNEILNGLDVMVGD